MALKKFCSILLLLSLNHFSKVLCFLISWKNKKSFGFLKFSEVIEMQAWLKLVNPVFLCFYSKWFSLCLKIVHILWILRIVNFKAIFWKLKFWQWHHFISETTSQSNRLLFLEIKLHKILFVTVLQEHWALQQGKTFLKVIKILRFCDFSTMSRKNLFHSFFICYVLITLPFFINLTNCLNWL